MTDTARPGEVEAVEESLGAAQSWVVQRMPDGGFSTVMLTNREIALNVVARAYPVIAAAVREQAAGDIEAMPINHDGPDPKHRAPLDAETIRRNAARVVRGGR